MTCPVSGVSEGVLAELLARIANKDVDAMEELHGLVRGNVLRWLRKVLRDPCQIEEGEQDVYRHIWLKAIHFDGEQYSPYAWLRTIARSRAIDCLRAQRRQRIAAQPEWWEQNLVSRALGPERQVQSRRRDIVLLRIVGDLKPEQRTLVQLAFFEEMSHDEIARRTGTPLGTVKTRIRKALSTMRETLEGVGIDRCS